MKRREATERWPSPAGDGQHAAKRLLLSVYVLAALTGGTLMVADAVRTTHVTTVQEGPADLVVDYLAAKGFHERYNPFSDAGAVRSGLSNFGPAGNAHPPTTSFWLLPFADRDLKTVFVIVDWATLLVILLEMVGLTTSLNSPAPLATAWLAFGFFVKSPLMASHMAAGQFSGLIGALLFAGWRCARGRNDELAGVALGAAASLKLFPAIVVLPFLLARRWRTVVFSAGSFLAMAAVMATQYGWASWLFFFRKQRIASLTWLPYIQNQSLHGIILRLFHPPCAPGPAPLSRGATILFLGIALSLLAVSLRWSRRLVRSGSVPDVVYALFVMLSVFVSEFSWEHYTAIFLLPFAITAAALIRVCRTGSRVRTRGMAAGGLVMLMAIAASWQQDITRKMTLQAQYAAGDHDVHFRLHLFEILSWLPNLTLLVMLLIVTWRSYARARAGAGQTFWGDASEAELSEP